MTQEQERAAQKAQKEQMIRRHLATTRQNRRLVAPDGWSVTDSGNGYYSYEYSPQAYLDALEKYKGDPEALARIRAGVRSFSNKWTAFDDLNTSFGGQSSADRLMKQYALNFDDYLKETLNNLETRDYNSEASKVNRMRQAGLNPDLQGLSQSSEEAFSAPDESLPDPAGIDAANSQKISSIASFGVQVSNAAMSLITGAVQMSKMFVDIEGSKLDNAGKEIANKVGEQSLVDYELGNEVKASDVALRGLLSMTPSDIKGDSEDFDAVFGNLIQSASKADYSNYSPATARLLRKMYSRYSGELVNGKPSLELEKLKTDFQKAISDNKLGIAHNAAQPGYSDDDITMIKDICMMFNEYYRDISKLRLEAERESYKASKVKDQYNQEYYGNLEGETRAEAENKTYENSKTEAETEKRTNDLWNRITDYLASKHSTLATIMLAMVPGIRQFLESPRLPSFHSSSSEGNNASEWTKQGGFSSGHTSSRSFGFN